MTYHTNVIMLNKKICLNTKKENKNFTKVNKIKINNVK